MKTLIKLLHGLGLYILTKPVSENFKIITVVFDESFKWGPNSELIFVVRQ